MVRESQLKAAEKYNKQRVNVCFRLMPDEKKKLEEYCKSRNESMAHFLMRAAVEQMRRDSE